MPKPTNITDLSPRVAARLLTEAGFRRVSETDVKRWLEAGAPAEGGRVNLFSLAAWLLGEVEKKDSDEATP